MKSTSGPKLDKAAFGSNVRIAMLVPLFKFVWNGSIRSKLVQFCLDMLKTLLTFYKIILSICGWFQSHAGSLLLAKHSENKWPFFYRTMHSICWWFQSHAGWLETQYKWSQFDEFVFGDWRFLWGLHSDYQSLEGSWRSVIENLN